MVLYIADYQVFSMLCGCEQWGLLIKKVYLAIHLPYII